MWRQACCCSGEVRTTFGECVALWIRCGLCRNYPQGLRLCFALAWVRLASGAGRACDEAIVDAALWGIDSLSLWERVG